MIINISRIGPVDATFEAPPSKSYTHRALIAAALASGRSRIMAPLRAIDTEATARGLESLGVPVEWSSGEITVTGCGGTFPVSGEVTIDCETSGRHCGCSPRRRSSPRTRWCSRGVPGCLSGR